MSASGGRLGCYLSPDDRERRVTEIADQIGASISEYGRSVEGRPLRAIRAPGERDGLPRVLCAANIHGIEYVGGLVALGFLESLGHDDAAISRLRSRAEVWVIPCINPDGYARTWDQLGEGRLKTMRTNARGVDLNRNFPLPPGARKSSLRAAGSDRPGDSTYRGASALSEPETAALDELLRAHDFHASANLHSFMGTLIPARVTDREHYRAYRDLCRAFSAAQKRPRYRRLASRLFDVFTGEQEDHQHHVLSTWAVCVETFSIPASFRQHLRAPSRFWRFNPRVPAPWIENDVPGLVAFFSAALDRERP